ncbi:MAG: molybdopterin-containing oxidoreductase family protein [Polyangiales bacterium]
MRNDSQLIYTTCRYCESCCGLAVEVDVKANRVVRIKADKENPGSWRDVCNKGLSAHEVVEHPQRLRYPMKRVGDGYVRVGYDEAVEGVASDLRRIMDEHGPDAIGSYIGNPVGFGSDIIFALGLIDGIGTKSRFSASSLDQNNQHVVSQALFGYTFVPFSPDVDGCDYLLLVGGNPATSKFGWLGSATDGWSRMRARQNQGATIVVVDPRRTRSAEDADLHLPIEPGTDWAFLIGVLAVVLREGLENADAVANLPADHVARLRALVEQVDLEAMSSWTGIPVSTVEEVARGYAGARGAMCLTMTGVSQNDTGTLAQWLSMVLDLVTGHFDRPGGRRWDSGFVNMTDFASRSLSEDGVSRVRGLDTVMGCRSVCELPDEIETPGEGRVRALIIQAGNPVVAGPDGAALDRALASLDCLVVVDLVQRESHRHAHWLIPAPHWLEREELPFNLANAQDRSFLQYANRAVDPPPDVPPEWRFFTDVALAMGVPMLGRPGFNSAIRASRWVSKVLRRPGLEISPALLERVAVTASKRATYKSIKEAPHGVAHAEKRFGQFAEFRKGAPILVAPEAFCRALANKLSESPKRSEAFPFVMTGSRSLHLMNSWLTELPNVQKRQKENRCEIHPDDAAALGISDGDRVNVRSQVAAIELPAEVTDRVRPGIVCIPHGWGSRVFNPAGGGEPIVYGANRNLLVDNRSLDPFSGTPKLNSTRVAVTRVE